jgi:uncharacterized protein
VKTRSVVICFASGFLLVSASVGLCADLKKGLDAYSAHDYATALRELKPLAEQGNAVAQYGLGIMYDNGQGVPEDDKEAVKWYRLAAEQGNVLAQYDLGVSYDNRLDYNEAVKWYRLAAEQGYARAQSNLGAMYNNGQGVPKDLMYAYMWSNIAVSLGDTNAAKNRDDDAHRMTPSQLEKAQDLSRQCVQKNYKGC